MPCLAMLARFCHGGRIITATVMLVGVYGRVRLHILHMWAVFARHQCTRTTL